MHLEKGIEVLTPPEWKKLSTFATVCLTPLAANATKLPNRFIESRLKKNITPLHSFSKVRVTADLLNKF